MKVLDEDILLVDSFKVFNLEKERNAPLVTLYKYENFLFLYPGSFFGDSSLDNKIRKRNATLRTEEDCIICSLSKKNYISILSEENKKIIISDSNFINHNFFFNEISPIIFKIYYYHLFKTVEKFKNDIIYKQNENNSSVFLIKEGAIKLELNGSISDLFTLNKNLLDFIQEKSNEFKISFEKINELKNSYLNKNKIEEDINNKEILCEINKKNNYELFSSNGFDCLAIQEFFLDMKYMSTCKVISNNVIIKEIKKEYLTRIIKHEKEILPNFYNYILVKLISLVNILFSIFFKYR